MSDARLANFRDLDGLPTVDGGRIASGRLLRSSDPTCLEPQAVRAQLAESGARHVIDLRRAAEVSQRGCDHLWSTGEVIHHHICLMDDTVQVDPAVDGASAQALGAWYARVVEQRRDVVAALARLVSVTAEDGVLIHCSAGKDRTGVVVAVLLDLVGVADQHIVADYHRTRREMTGVLAALGHEGAGARSAVAGIFDAPAEAMETMLIHLRAVHGSLAALLAGAGLGERDRARLRAALVDHEPRACDGVLTGKVDSRPGDP